MYVTMPAVPEIVQLVLKFNERFYGFFIHVTNDERWQTSEMTVVIIHLSSIQGLYVFIVFFLLLD